MNTKQYDSYIAVADWLKQRDQPVAIILTEILEPSGGPGAVIFPPTYARDKTQMAKPGMDHPYPISILRSDIAPEAAHAQGIQANICDLDSVGSQANRMEPAFSKPPLNSLVPQRVIKAGTATVNLLQIAHRIADGAVRFSALGGEVTKAMAALGHERNAAELARLAPTSLVFGFWNSREKEDHKLAIKFPRLLSSIIRATNVAVLKRCAQFNPAFDPTMVGLEQAVEEAEESVEAKQTHPLAKLGLRSVPAVDTHGGVRVFGKITRQTEINLVALRAVAVVRDGKLDLQQA